MQGIFLIFYKLQVKCVNCEFTIGQVFRRGKKFSIKSVVLNLFPTAVYFGTFSKLAAQLE